MDMTTNKPRYDDIGHGYASTRQEDPQVRDSILEGARLGPDGRQRGRRGGLL